MSLIEIVVVIAIMGIAIYTFMTMFQHQVKANNYLEFQLKRSQLTNMIVSQFLDDPNNCSCLFAGSSAFAETPSAPGATLVGAQPTAIGRYNFVTPGVCGTATVPAPLINNVGIDGMRATSIELKQILNVSGAYSGKLVVNVESTKDVSGPRAFPVVIPVNVATTAPSGGTVTFLSCSVTSQQILTGDYVTGCRWSGVGTSPSFCTPPACDSGDTDLGIGCDQAYLLSGGSSGYKGGNCQRSCRTVFSSALRLREMSCPWGNSSGGSLPTCSPAACASGEIDKGIYCELAGSAPGGCCGTQWGSCKRQCFGN